jgi:transposase
MDTHEGSLANRFTPSDRLRLKRGLARAKDARQYRRLEAILAVAEGESVLQAARRVRSERSSVHRWLNRYWATRAIEALDDCQRCGRPRVARQLSNRRLTRILQKDPRVCGYEASSWTVALLAAHLRSQGVSLSDRTLRRRIREARFRWKRPRYVYSERADHVGAKKGGSFDG